MNSPHAQVRSVLLVSTALLLASTGCAVPAGGATGDVDKGIGGSSYYRQFTTQPDWDRGEYSDGTAQWTRIASSDDVTIETPEGERREATATFYLLSNGDAYVDYREVGPEEHLGGGVIGQEVIGSLLLLTTWDVEGDFMYVEGIGRGLPLTYNGEDAIGFQFTHDLISAGLDGRGATVRMGLSSVPLERIEAQYECGGDCD